MWFFAHKSLPNLLFGMLCLPGDQSHPVCATDNKPSCKLHLLYIYIYIYTSQIYSGVLGSELRVY